VLLPFFSSGTKTPSSTLAPDDRALRREREREGEGGGKAEKGERGAAIERGKDSERG
jgi:hypothetical protein